MCVYIYIYICREREVHTYTHTIHIYHTNTYYCFLFLLGGDGLWGSPCAERAKRLSPALKPTGGPRCHNGI